MKFIPLASLCCLFLGPYFPTTSAFSPLKLSTDKEPSLDVWSNEELSRRPFIATTALAIGCIIIPAPPSVAAGFDIAHGQQLFQASCAGCHAGGQNFVAPKKTLSKADLETYRKTIDPAILQKFVQSEMPHKLLPFSKEWTDQDYSDVVDYVVSQAVENKW